MNYIDVNHTKTCTLQSHMYTKPPVHLCVHRLVSCCHVTGGVTNQSIPIVLPVKTEDKQRLEGCHAFSLTYTGKYVAVMRRPEFFPHNKEERCCRQFGTSNKGHPYVKVSVVVSRF